MRVLEEDSYRAGADRVAAEMRALPPVETFLRGVLALERRGPAAAGPRVEPRD